MLNDLRKQFNNPILLALLAMIAVAFVFTFGSWGGSDVSGVLPVVARVNGSTIAQAEFSQNYRARFNQGRLTPETAKKQGLKKTVLDQLIDRELLAQEAERRGLIATDKELAKTIKELIFGEDAYDKAEYHRQIRERYGSTPAYFEDSIRRDLQVQKMQNVIVDAQRVSPAELKEAFLEKNDKVDLHVVKIDPTFFKKKIIDLSDAELKTWADANEDKIKEDYDKHITRYKIPKKVKARHILIKVAKDASDADKKAARTKIEAAKKRVDGGEDFATVAKELSEEPGAKTSGGDLGLFGPGHFLKPPFEETAFAMKKGEISAIIETELGFHVILVEEVQEASIKELADVKIDIAKPLYKDLKAMEQAQALAKEAIAQLKSGVEPKDLKLPEFRTGDEVLSDEKPNPYAPRLDATGPFARMSRFGMGGYIPRVGISEDLVKAAFDLTAEKAIPETAFEVSGRLFVVKLKERQKPDLKKFADEKATLEKNMLGQRTYKAVETFVKELRKGADIWIEPSVLKYDS